MGQSFSSHRDEYAAEPLPRHPCHNSPVSSRGTTVEARVIDAAYLTSTGNCPVLAAGCRLPTAHCGLPTGAAS